MRVVLTALLFLSASLVHSQETAGNNPVERLLATAQKSSMWKTARSQSDRLGLLREYALKAAGEGQITDRYLITAYGGPIDLVHFFGMARLVCAGSEERRTLLLKQWNREGGADYVAKTPGRQYDATPDDLPSNALGALFGEDMKARDLDLNANLPEALTAFLRDLHPVPDEVVAKFSFDQLVLGIEGETSAEIRRSRSEWFKAEPLYILALVSPDRAATVPDAAAALRSAGLVVRNHEDQPIIIDRASTPEPPTKPQPKVFAKPRVTKAVPVQEAPVTRAVPVRD